MNWLESIGHDGYYLHPNAEALELLNAVEKVTDGEEAKA